MADVHLRSGGSCYPAVVLARGGGSLLLLRVSQATPRTDPVGYLDSEGWYPHESEALSVPNPPSIGGGHRKLDGWHLPAGSLEGDCQELTPIPPDRTWAGVDEAGRIPG